MAGVREDLLRQILEDAFARARKVAGETGFPASQLISIVNGIVQEYKNAPLFSDDVLPHQFDRNVHLLKWYIDATIDRFAGVPLKNPGESAQAWLTRMLPFMEFKLVADVLPKYQHLIPATLQAAQQIIARGEGIEFERLEADWGDTIFDIYQGLVDGGKDSTVRADLGSIDYGERIKDYLLQNDKIATVMERRFGAAQRDQISEDIIREFGRRLRTWALSHGPKTGDQINAYIQNTLTEEALQFIMER